MNDLQINNTKCYSKLDMDIAEPIKRNNCYHCKCCSRKYKIKDNYNKHIGPCEFFHRTSTMKQDDFNNYTEQIPTQIELFNLVKELAAKCSHLEREIVQIKNAANMKRRKNITEWLNTQRSHVTPFTLWYNDITIDNSMLAQVLQTNLVNGLKIALELHISKYNTGDVPIACFHQKTGAIYVYEEGWKIVTNDSLVAMINYISRLYLVEFIEWREKSSEWTTSHDEKTIEQDITNMSIINGHRITIDNKVKEIRKWLHDKLAENLDRIIVEIV